MIQHVEEEKKWERDREKQRQGRDRERGRQTDGVEPLLPNIPN